MAYKTLCHLEQQKKLYRFGFYAQQTFYWWMVLGIQEADFYRNKLPSQEGANRLSYDFPQVCGQRATQCCLYVCICKH